ncbi:MAG: hypothetical protein K5695_15930 [Oscillospiraceae bacterium]|nr:hypothetical protein [Oscillospiraceae bacterium]
MQKKLIAFLLLGAMLAATGCAGKTESSSVAETEPTAQEVTEATTEEVTEAPTNAPFPEADPNAVTFDNVGADIAVIVVDDDASVDGTLSIESVDGNNMFKFTDNTTTADNISKAVQKVRIDVTKLLAKEQLELVDHIEFDVCAQAKDTVFVNDDGDTPKVPGWIGGGGGTETCDGNWYGFTDFSASGIQEYDLERCDMYHVSFKFLLAASGKKWDDTMTQPYLQIMRWGIQNISDFYIDNITFYDADGNSIPLTISEGWAETGEEEGAAEETEEAAEETEAAPEEAPAEETEDTTEETTEESAA